MGHLITPEGVVAYPDKIAAMKSWPQPTNLQQLRGFLGLTGYYRRFVKGYDTISKPLTDMLRKDSFVWSADVVQDFSLLKNATITAKILALPDFTKPFVLETDACSSGVGVVLMQEGKPISFYSKSLGPKALALSTYEKELLAIVMDVQKWTQSLMGYSFIMNTDHQQRITTVMQQKWLSKLLGMDYVIR